MGVLMNNKLTTYRVEYLCGGCNKAHAWGECTEEKELKNEPVAYVTGLNKFDSKMVDTVLKVGTPLYTHPAKELHLSLQKSKETGELLAVTYTDDEHRIVEVLWKKPPAKTLTDEEIDILVHEYNCIDDYPHEFVRACIRKAQEK